MSDDLARVKIKRGDSPRPDTLLSLRTFIETFQQAALTRVEPAATTRRMFRTATIFVMLLACIYVGNSELKSWKGKIGEILLMMMMMKGI